MLFDVFSWLFGTVLDEASCLCCLRSNCRHAQLLRRSSSVGGGIPRGVHRHQDQNRVPVPHCVQLCLVFCRSRRLWRSPQRSQRRGPVTDFRQHSPCWKQFDSEIQSETEGRDPSSFPLDLEFCCGGMFGSLCRVLG